MIDVDVPFSPGWWLNKCSKKLAARQPRIQRLWDRFEGNGPMPIGDDSEMERHREFRRKSRTNYAELVVEATRYRMMLINFLTAVESGPEGDQTAAEVWDANAMQVEFPEMVTKMLAVGDGYGMVGFDGTMPVITSEDPRQVVTIHDPVRQRDIRAAAKLFHDDDYDLDLAYVFLPPAEGQTEATRHVAFRERRARTGRLQFSPSSWSWDEERGGEEGEGIIVGRVPVVRLRNRQGVGEFERHTDLLDRLDDRVLEQRTITAFQAYRQRALKGDLPDHDEQGKKIDYDELFEAGPNALWRLPEGIDLWESAVAEMNGVLLADDKDVRKLSAVTMTPMYVFSPEAASGSAEGAALMKETGVSKARDRCVRAGEGARDLMSLAFEYLGDNARADRSKIRPVWYPPEMRSLAEMADADSKSTLPFGTKLTKIYGLNATEAALAESEREHDALLADVTATA